MNCASARCSRATPPLHDGEARAGNLRGGFEIEAAELFAELDVILRREVELARLAPAAHFLVRRLVAAFGHGLVQQVGQAELPGVELGLHAGDGRVAGRELAASVLRRASAARSASSPLPLAMPTALALALRSARTRSDSTCAALRRSSSALNAATSSVEPAAREIGGDGGGIGAKLFGVEHLDPFVNLLRNRAMSADLHARARAASEATDDGRRHVRHAGPAKNPATRFRARTRNRW